MGGKGRAAGNRCAASRAPARRCVARHRATRSRIACTTSSDSSRCTLCPAFTAVMCTLSVDSAASSSCMLDHVGQRSHQRLALLITVSGSASRSWGRPRSCAARIISRTAICRCLEDRVIARAAPTYSGIVSRVRLAQSTALSRPRDAASRRAPAGAIGAARRATGASRCPATSRTAVTGPRGWSRPAASRSRQPGSGPGSGGRRCRRANARR